jgi:hypothetical protein
VAYFDLIKLRSAADTVECINRRLPEPRVLPILLQVLLAMTLVGCASLNEKSRHQFVYVDSKPPGATIWYQEKNLGITPAIVRLKRDKNILLNLNLKQESKLVNLESSYRWLESGLIGLYLGGLAPLSWGVDFATGAAWNLRDPSAVEFHDSNSSTVRPQVLIAPPMAATKELSDGAGQAWFQFLKDPALHLAPLDYQENLQVNLNSGFDFDVQMANYQNLEELRSLMYSVKVNRVLLSSVSEKEGQLVLTGYQIDPKGKKLEPEWLFEKKGSSHPDSWVSKYPWMNGLIPNSAGVDMSSNRLTLSDLSGEYTAAPMRVNSSWAETFRYFSAINISYLTVPRFEDHWRSKFHWISAVNTTYQRFFFPDYVELADVSFDYKRFGFGIGLEFTFQKGHWSAYYQYVPMLEWTMLGWDQPGGSRMVREHWASLGQLRSGVRYFLDNRWSVEIYSMLHSIDDELWTIATKTVNPQTPELVDQRYISSGVTFNYTFDLHQHF